MSARIVRLGSERGEGEGLRIGTVRRPPRGVPKAEFSSRNYYDVWFPNLAPSPELLKEAWMPRICSSQPLPEANCKSSVTMR